MGTLQAALAWAARGYRVFPLQENAKVPAHGESWPDIATNDPDVIRALWTDPVIRTERSYNIGVDCTGGVVLDIDMKNGKRGTDEYAALGGTYDTLTVMTPTGGYHCYFTGPDSGNAALSASIDVRSHRGYVVAPGSVIDGAAYQVVVDAPAAPLPGHLVSRLAPVRTRAERGPVEPVDDSTSIIAATGFLQTCPPAIEGQRGDETTFVTAARLVREFALSEGVALALMLDHYNPRCVPPWSEDELARKIENAAQYGTAEHGKWEASRVFAGVQVAPPPTMLQQAAVDFGNGVALHDIPKRPWLMDRTLMLHETTLILAPGSAGKSSLTLAIAAHLAMGRDFAGRKTHVQCKSVVYNGEDDVTEQSRRLYAVCVQYGFDYDYVRSRVILLSSDEIDLRLVVTPHGRVPEVNHTVYNALVQVASDPDVGVIAYDPLVDVHTCEEQDNAQMNFVMRTIREVARAANVASIVAHHTTKTGSEKQEHRVGNMDIARGASGIVFKSRIAFTLMNATTQDMEDYGLTERDMMQYVRLDDAKANLYLRSHEPSWFRRDGVKLPNGDVIGVIAATELTKNTMHIRVRMAELFCATMTANGSATMTMAQAVALLKTQDPLFSNRSDSDTRKRIEATFAVPVEHREFTLHVSRETANAAPLLVMR